MTTPSEPLTETADKPHAISRATTIKCFVAILALSFILRIAYAGHLYEDDGLWFTAGEEILRGKALYRDIYFDKPPGLALVYAALFWIFGAHILTVRLFTILYSVAISGVLYKFGSRLYGRPTGLLAAAMFAVFSTTYSAGHFQGLNTDLLMALPYTAGALMMAGSLCWSSTEAKARWHALAGGALAGVAFQINPKGVFDLVFYAVLLGASRVLMNRRRAAQDSAAPEESPSLSELPPVRPIWLFCLAAIGFVGGALPFLVYILGTGSLGRYWFYVWDWGARYGAYYKPGATLLATLSRSAGYFAVNNTLLIGLAFVAVSFFRRRGFSGGRAPVGTGLAGPASEAYLKLRREFESDRILLIWFAVSFAGVMLGGRLFPHYFFQTLPSLCLIGARGIFGINSALNARTPYLKRAAVTLIALGLMFTLVRFHGRSVLLFSDWVRGTASEANSDWYPEIRNREERLVAAVVTGAGENDTTDRSDIEAFRTVGKRNRQAGGALGYLFVWGYRPEIYYWSGMLPASRYLSTQPLTGVPADVHYFGNNYKSLITEDAAASARAELLRDLEATGPKYIVDELGFFNSSLSIQSYPELQSFMTRYKPLGTTGRFFIYLNKEYSKKNQRRKSRSN